MNHCNFLTWFFVFLFLIKILYHDCKFLTFLFNDISFCKDQMNWHFLFFFFSNLRKFHYIIQDKKMFQSFCPIFNLSITMHFCSLNTHTCVIQFISKFTKSTFRHNCITDSIMVMFTKNCLQKYFCW